MNNYNNRNDIFPILELIDRERKREAFNQNRQYYDLNSDTVTGSEEDVESVEALRGSNTFDPELIDSVLVTYVGGGTETIEVVRGVNPPVPSTVTDHEFINKALISGIVIKESRGSVNRTITIGVERENGYGKILKVNFTYA